MGVNEMVASEAPQQNLPLQSSSLIGRAKELVELAGALNKTRLLTLSGVGGVGKTRLALALAEHVGGSYTDGTWFIELAALADAALTPQTVAAAVSLPLAPGAEPLSGLLTYFHARHALLILDNCEHLLAGCAALADALLRHCAHVQIIATSREPLGIAGELRWRVPPLAAPTDECLAATELRRYSAVELFVTRVQSALPQFELSDGNAHNVGRICMRLDGIPLALELAAARARAVPLDVIAERLDQRFRLLTGGDRTAVPRQQTLAAAIGWSHDLLTDDERRLFRGLSVFAGGWTLDAAERICATDASAGGEVLDLLTRLIDKSMVVAEAGPRGIDRYRLLETLRQYGQERLAESGEGDGMRDRHFAYYLALVKTAHTEVAAPRQRDGWLRRLDADNDNIRAALTWGSERDPRAALRLAVDASWHWWYRRRHLEGVGWLETLLESAPDDTLLQARALAHIGLLAREYGDVERAQRVLSEARVRFDALGNRRGQAHVLNTLTLLCLAQERLADARAAATECLRLNQEIGDLARQGFALTHLGFVATVEEDFLAASHWHTQSLRLARSLGDRFRIMRQCYLLGTIRRLLGDYSAAVELFAEAAPLLDAQDPWTRAWEWMFPGDLAVDQGQYARAAELYQQALDYNQRVSHRGGVSWVTQRLGILVIRMGDPRRGVRILAATQAISAPMLRGNVPELAYERRRALDDARVVGDDAFAAEYSSGQALTLEEAALLALQDAPIEHAASALDGPLTPRQLEVAMLIARGLTNRQIGERLVVSTHTVERHVENILQKLRLASRTEIAVWMVERERG